MNATSAKTSASNGPAAQDAATDTQPEQNSTTKKNDGFITIQTQRFMYNVERCKGKPLQGHLLAVIPMPPIDDRVWHAFLIRTTEETLGINRDDEVVPVAAGQDVLVPATHELAQFLGRPSQHPTAVFEVRIEPDHKIAVGKSKEMWLYKLASKPVPVLRKQFGVVALVDMSPRQLTAGRGADTSESADWMNDSTIPF